MLTLAYYWKGLVFVLFHKSCEQKSDTLIGFFGMHSPYSSVYVFKWMEKHLTTVGNIFTWIKQHDAMVILLEQRSWWQNTLEIKMYYGNMKGFILQKWEWDRARNVAFTVLKKKFGQNEYLRNSELRLERSWFFMWLQIECGAVDINIAPQH